MGMSVGWQ